MSFFEIFGTRLINRRHIREARLTGTWKDKLRDTIITLDDGERVNLQGNHLKYLTEISAIIVPAEAGYCTLNYGWDEGDEWVNTHPVIAWRIEGFGVDPITPDWGMNDDNDSTILYPDGRVVLPGDRSWPSLDEWKADMAKEAAAKRARAEKVA